MSEACAVSSADTSPIAYAVVGPDQATNGTSTRSSFGSQGELYYFRRAVDQNGVAVDILVQPRRNAKAAKRIFKRLLQVLQHVPRVIVADKLRSYGAAKCNVLPEVEHRKAAA